MAKLLTGIVVSNKMTNTIVIRVERKFRHPMYQKVITKHSKHKAHCDDAKAFQIGDTVTIKETKPISKDKHFIVVEKVLDKKS